MEFEEIKPNVWQPKEEGDVIEGVLITKRKNVGPNDSNAYYLEKDKAQIMIWGSTVLDSRMDFVDVGQYVRITFKGTEPNTKGQPTKIFKVEKADVKE